MFHNRTQQHRRTDGGRYEWPRAGRLGRWLALCRYPNFAQSGLRDFEHLRLPRDTAFTRYEWVGVHPISLFLIAGSNFRTAAPKRVGLDAAGRPVDARNQAISLPELIHMTGAMAADCVTRRFRRERGWAPPAYQAVEKRHERRPDKAKSDEKAQFICNK